MAIQSVNLRTVRAGLNRLPAKIDEFEQRTNITSLAVSILKDAQKAADSLLLKMNTAQDAKKVLQAALAMERNVLLDLKEDNWQIRSLLCPLFHENEDDLSADDLKALKREVLLFCFRRELDARKFLKKELSGTAEPFNFRIETATPPGKPRGRYLAASMSCPLKQDFHTRPQGDVFNYGRLFADYPIFILRKDQITGKPMALEISKDEFDGILETIYHKQIMTFYSQRTDEMAKMILKGLLNLIRLADTYECDNAVPANRRQIDVKFI